MGPRLLLVEDDPTIGRSLTLALEGQEYAVTWATDGAAARASITNDEPALVLLDLGLPDVDGVDLCRELRSSTDVPIVVLTARQEEVDIVIGLDAGADDYITKPFRLAELLARIRAHLRRPSTVDADGLVVANLAIDRAARRVRVGDRELQLRPREFDLLVLLAEQRDAAVAREAIMAAVWDEHWYGSTKTLDVHVSSLRRKLAELDANVSITALPRVGYRLEAS